MPSQRPVLTVDLLKFQGKPPMPNRHRKTLTIGDSVLEVIGAGLLGMIGAMLAVLTMTGK